MKAQTPFRTGFRAGIYIEFNDCFALFFALFNQINRRSLKPIPAAPTQSRNRSNIMKTQLILAAVLSALAFNTFAADGFDRTQSSTFAEDGYNSTRSATFAEDGYNKTHSATFAEDGYNKTHSATFAEDGYDKTHSATFAEDGYDKTQSATFAEDGYDRTKGASIS
ncbi:heme utilization protein [Pseudomonas sp. CCC3.1]|uniref:heme utilization protein n=1 Tax=Pseudomonas sp. CCC3.1 TaxID=3048607 RepID=UPI002AC93C07|nr:heme utilization protein [Pseudomonas sp. CCC3.1]MEB0207574.1 heme utilization protein [Pseudomonas sp. CCC3.1]WPX37323.1 heme utilization protein [Pseudomonas sp. CCC3.1]